MLWRSRLALCATALLLASCTSANTPSDAGPADAASPIQCGPAPYVKMDGTVEEFQVGPYRKKEGAKITFDLCPGVVGTTDAEGKATFYVSKGKPFYALVDNPDDIPMMFPEWVLEADFVGTTVVIPTSYQSSLAPDFAADKTLIAIAIQGPDVSRDAGPAEPCRSAAGVKITIPGHPEAKVIYYSADTLPKPDPTLTESSASGVAVVTGLADGAVVEVAAVKAGCTVTGKHDGFTGRATVKKGRYVGYLLALGK